MHVRVHCMCNAYALHVHCMCTACALHVHCMCKVIKRMIKWVKYMLLLHLFAGYVTFRPLPCTSLRELHATFLYRLRSQSWFLPLVAEDSPWLVAEAFGGADAANTTAAADEPSAPSDAISMGALVTLLVLLVALSGILGVCLCDCTCARLCAAQSRRLQALTHDVVRSQDVSRWPQGFAQICIVQTHCTCTADASHMHCISCTGRRRSSPRCGRSTSASYSSRPSWATCRGCHRSPPRSWAPSTRRSVGCPRLAPSSISTRSRPTYYVLICLPCLPCTSCTSCMSCIPCLLCLPHSPYTLLLNKVTWRRGRTLLCRGVTAIGCVGADQSVPWYEWLAASRAAAHTVGVKTYKPRDHPHYRDACDVILAAEQSTHPEEAAARAERRLTQSPHCSESGSAGYSSTSHRASMSGSQHGRPRQATTRSSVQHSSGGDGAQVHDCRPRSSTVQSAQLHHGAL